MAQLADSKRTRVHRWPEAGLLAVLTDAPVHCECNQ